MPEVSRPVGSPEHVLYSSASWVGLDGYDTADGLQAGVGQDVEPDGKISYYAWFEWFAPPEPNSPSYIYSTTITNFLVNPGQTVYCLVQYLTNHTGGYVYFANNDTGEHFPMTLNPPPGAAFTGDTANWIMESVDEPPAALPKFTTLEFTSAWCCGEHSSTGSPGGVGGAGVGVTPVNIGIPGPDNTSNPLTDVVSGVGTVTITYEGP